MDKNIRDKPDDQPCGKRQCKSTEQEKNDDPTSDKIDKEKAAKERLHDKYYDGNKLYPRWIIRRGQKIFLPPPWDDGQYYYSPREFRGLYPWEIRRLDEDKEKY